MRVRIEKLHTDGSGFVKDNDYTYHIWNSLPGEEVEIEIIKKKRRHVEAVATHIHSPSPYRILPKEKEFISSSPWQIVAPEAELLLKKESALFVFQDFPEITDLLKKSDVCTNNIRENYRQKMEYHVYTDDDNNFHLGIFGRIQKKKIPIPPSILATTSLNATASEIIKWLDNIKFSRPLLKTIIVRSNSKGETIAGLFIKTKEIELLKQNPFDNLTLYYSEPKSPASVATEILQQGKIHTLTETLLGKTFTYGLMSFFQINPPVFEETLQDINKYMGIDEHVVDFYSGVGTIGLCLERTKTLVLVEENQDAVMFAKENIKQNDAKNTETFLGQAHDLREHIVEDSVLIVDPPRSGLHPKVIKKILQELPHTLIYLSCNIESQARDTKELYEKYTPVFTKLYNFFPMTPHIESVIVFKKR